MKTIFTLALAIFFQMNVSSLFASTPNGFGQLRANLYIVSPNGSTVLMDGSLTQYYSDYSNNIDVMDARKMSNFSENWGMLRNDRVYVIERRHTIGGSDSIFFKMWNMRIITYQIELIASDLAQDGRQAILEDKYLKTSTPVNLNGNTFVNFSVNTDPDSKTPERFRIIFSNEPAAGLLPLDFTSVNAFKKINSVEISWGTTNEKNVKQLDIERSLNGIDFSNLNFVAAQNNWVNNYNWVDATPVEGNNYYRIVSRDLDGRKTYSKVMKVYVDKALQSIAVFPNPATINNFNLRMTNQPAGRYELRLINSSGQSFINKTIQYAGGSSIERIDLLSTIPKGIYQLEIKNP
ncbi:MAG: T9SS type A sorting domain-containing protein, partial [Ginsengibacter sp.]